MLVICPIFDRCDLLPFYLRYYTRLGATQFVVALWNGERNPVFEVVKSYTNWPIEIRTSIECLVKDYNGPDESHGLNQIRLEFKERGFPWYCLADLDEFCWFKDGKTMPQIVAEAEAAGFNAVHGTFYDRLARNGKFPPIGEVLDDTFPLTAEITKAMGATTGKVPLSHIDLAVESGHHYTKGKPWWNQVEVHHFKWTDGVVGRLRERDMYFTAQGLPWSGESKRCLEAVLDEDFSTNPRYRWREARKIGI
jgi:hypothetical protein